MILLIIINHLIILLPYVNCWIDPSCPLGYHPQQCTSDGRGYMSYYCDKDNKYKISAFRGKVSCPRKEICKCSINPNNEDPSQVCRCVNPTRRPPFPPTGVIRWNGTVLYQDRFSEVVGGEAHKNGNGYYLMWKIDVWWPNGEDSPVDKKQLFEIIIPNENGKSFTKYTGDVGSNKTCKKEEVNSAGRLDLIWEKHLRQFYYLKNETSKNAYIDTQIWYQSETGYMTEEEWKMTLEYDKKKHYAIPVNYYNYYGDLRGYLDDWKADYDYVYVPIRDTDETFQPHEYCSNI